jgi:hypothetical protein
MRRSLARTIQIAWTSVLVGLAGCGSGPPPSEPPPRAPDAARPAVPLSLGIRDGELPFTEYADGQDVTLVQGAQGGFHVWLRYRYEGQPGVQAELERSARRAADDALVLRSTSQVAMVAESDAMPMFMCPSPIGLSVIDRSIVFRLRFSDEEGVLAEGAVTLVPHCPDENREFCLRICTG